MKITSSPIVFSGLTNEGVLRITCYGNTNRYFQMNNMKHTHRCYISNVLHYTVIIELCNNTKSYGNRISIVFDCKFRSILKAFTMHFISDEPQLIETVTRHDLTTSELPSGRLPFLIKLK